MCTHQIFCKSSQKNMKQPLSVAPENNLESTHNQSPLYLSWLLHVIYYSCCYFISIPMHIAAVWQHKAIKSPTNNTCRWEIMIRSLPPWPQHRTAPIKRSYSNVPMDLRRTVECLFCQALRPKAIYLLTAAGGVVIILLFFCCDEKKGELLL